MDSEKIIQKTEKKSVITWIWFFCVMMGNIFFFVFDQREVIDLGHYYFQLSDWLRFWENTSSVALFDLLRISGAWYNAIIAGFLVLGISGKLVFFGFASFWLVGIFLFLQRHSSVAVLLTTTMPIWTISFRTNWLHFVEVSMICWLLMAERSIVIFLLSFLLVWLRPTALIWLCLLCCYFLYQKQPKFVVMIGSAVLVAVMFLWPTLSRYVFGKMMVIPIKRNMLIELFEQIFYIPLLFSLLGIGNLITLKKYCAFDVFLLATMIVAVSVSWLFGVGIDNFLIFHLALGIVGAKGLSLMTGQQKIREYSLLGWGIGMLLLPYSPIFVREKLFPPPEWSFLSVMEDEATTLNEVRPALEKICTGQRQQPCHILSSRGLFHPHREEDGSLAFILNGIENIRIHNSALWWTRKDIFSPNLPKGLIISECQSETSNQDIFQEKEKYAQIFSEIVTTIEIARIQSNDCSIRFLRVVDPNFRQKLRSFYQRTVSQESILEEN